MSDLRRGGWLLARADTLEEVAHMVVAFVEPNRARWQWLLQQFRALALSVPRLTKIQPSVPLKVTPL